MGQGAGFFAFDAASADLTEDRAKSVGQGFVIGPQRERVRAGCLSHAVLLSAKTSAHGPVEGSPDSLHALCLNVTN